MLSDLLAHGAPCTRGQVIEGSELSRSSIPVENQILLDPPSKFCSFGIRRNV